MYLSPADLRLAHTACHGCTARMLHQAPSMHSACLIMDIQCAEYTERMGNYTHVMHASVQHRKCQAAKWEPMCRCWQGAPAPAAAPRAERGLRLVAARAAAQPGPAGARGVGRRVVLNHLLRQLRAPLPQRVLERARHNYSHGQG